MEAVKLGSATVGLKSRDYAVLVALKRASSELASFQKKIIPIDDHMGISIAGITADARVLSRYMRQECLNYKYSFDTTYPVARLISNLGNRMQTCTQRYDRRPYGVGLLVAGYDDQGPQIFEVVPSANYFNCKAMSIGSRSQSARTYLEKHLNEFIDCSKDELIKHGLTALKGTLPNEDLLTNSVNRFFFGNYLFFGKLARNFLCVFFSIRTEHFNCSRWQEREIPYRERRRKCALRFGR